MLVVGTVGIIGNEDRWDEVTCAWVDLFEVVCVYIFEVGVGWGKRTGMTVPYYSGVIRTALRTDSLI